jgi:hypothetical protein
MRKCLFPLLLALAVSLAAPVRRADASGGVSISFFYDELSPHGDWVTVEAMAIVGAPAASIGIGSLI